MNNGPKIEKYESSSEKINYLIRPAKQIERKLIIEAFSKLAKVYPIDTYQYIGMGSLFYVDFRMFHKYLGIKDMISMEKEEDKIDRFKFNKPYNFINLISGMSTNILPTLHWDNYKFIWLDYDFRISSVVISDIQIVSEYIQPGGILIVTLDAEPERFNSTERKPQLSVNKDRLINLKEEVGPFCPSDVSEKDLSVRNYPLLLRRIIINVLEDELRKRDLFFFQIFNFKYADTSRMYTFGCIFDESPKELEKSNIFNLDFISKNATLVEINIPIITPLEKIHFDKLIPNIATKLEIFHMDKKKLYNYEKYYKHYPQYFESLL